MDVRYMHRVGPRACGKLYTTMSGPLTVDGGFDTSKTTFVAPTGAHCTCADGGKRTPDNLHMLNPVEMAAAESKTDKSGAEWLEVDIAMSKAEDDDDADGAPHIAEDLPVVEAKKPKA